MLRHNLISKLLPRTSQRQRMLNDLAQFEHQGRWTSSLRFSSSGNKALMVKGFMQDYATTKLCRDHNWIMSIENLDPRESPGVIVVSLSHYLKDSTKRLYRLHWSEFSTFLSACNPS